MTQEVQVIEPHEITIIDDNKVGEDYEKARTNIIDILETGQEALAEISQIAKVSQDALSYDVLAKTMNSLIVANKALLEIAREKESIQRYKNNGKDPSKTVTNNLFVGTPAELAELLEDMRNR